MKRILIADASKASLVMTSEVFKDHFPGVQVVVARTSADALELAKAVGELDAFIIDYDLPDRDGAYTAARLKKMFTQPILITAYDRPDVQESIDRELSAFDDCLSWLKKPVRPELVVSLAQRFIEGKNRCQRRVSCSIPAFLEIEFLPSALTPVAASTFQVARAKVVAKSKKPTQKPKTTKNVKGAQDVKNSKTTKSVTNVRDTKVTKPLKTQTTTKAKKAAVVPQGPIRKFIPVTLDDVSLCGAKIRIHNQDLIFSGLGAGKASLGMLDLREGQILQVHVPPAQIVEAGADALLKWQKAQSKEWNGTDAKTLKTKGADATKSTTLNPIGERTRQALAKSEQNSAVAGESKSFQVILKGEIRWAASSEMFTFYGLRSETVNVSKKLFESMIEIEARSRRSLSPIIAPSASRSSKLNA